MTDATVERTMAAAAEKPFMMLSVYFTTTDVYRPPTLAKTGSKQREQCQSKQSVGKSTENNSLNLIILTHYKAHPGRITEEEAFLQDLIAISHENTNEGDHNAGQVHLDVPHPQRRV